MYRINNFEINFLDKHMQRTESHKTTYKIKPFCEFPRNVKLTIKEDIKKAIGSNRSDRVIIISTNKGKFYYQKYKRLN